MLNIKIACQCTFWSSQGEAAAAGDRAANNSIPEPTAKPTKSTGGGGWGRLKGDSQPATPVQPPTESKVPIKQDSADTIKKPKAGTHNPDDGRGGIASGKTRQSFDQNEVILGQSFSEFKSDIKKEVADVHSKISNMEDLLKNILQNLEK